ncbi:MAG: FapA family protein [Treponema sp.]|nr:FapA family protein [Treponema sp.]
MVTLEKIRIDMGSRLKLDREITTVEVIADTLEEALADAAVQLETRVSCLEYEVLEKGFAGIVGIAKKPWKIRAYENPLEAQKKKKNVVQTGEGGSDGQVEEELQSLDRDGVFYVHRFGSRICLKVVLPKGEGRPVKFGEVLASAKRSDTETLEEDIIRKAVDSGTSGEYVDIGTFKRDTAADAIMAVDVSKDEMHATISVSAPGLGGSEISKKNILSALTTQGVVAGILEDKIDEFIDIPVYGTDYEVAAAVLPVDGADASITYHFETDRSKLRLKETESGQVDFKELNLIQNVVAGQPLAQKNLAQRGKGGKTITGHYLEAKNGKDIPLPLGANVRLADDGRTIIAEKNGQVMLVGDKITVEEIYEVPGVNLKTGNITFMGTVVCRGDVEDGFSIKANGNVEIYGSVGACKIEADGDIVISQGVMGRDECEIYTPKTLWARFIQNSKVQVGEFVVVNDSIVNSNVSAMKKILLKGKKAQIIGGHLFATEEISAKNIGSSGGSVETVLEVGFDPQAKQRLLELQGMQSTIVKELEEIDLNIATLENQKEIRRSLPKEKEESLQKFMERKGEIISQNEVWSQEIESIEMRLRELKVVGRVNASGTVYAGVKIFVRDEKDEVKNEVKSVSFYYENGFVRRGKYDPSQVTANVRGPDGYTSD